MFHAVNNDVVIRIWDQNENRSRSEITHFFSSFFYESLESDGPENVKNWTARKEINIFKKQLIFIPINYSLHWSLMVIVNPGLILQNKNILEERNPEEQLSFFLFLDSLKAHRKARIAHILRGWLNYEWNLCHDEKNPFDKETMKLYNPKGKLETDFFVGGFVYFFLILI